MQMQILWEVLEALPETPTFLVLVVLVALFFTLRTEDGLQPKKIYKNKRYGRKEIKNIIMCAVRLFRY